MSRVSNEAGDSPELVPPPHKKTKTDPVPEAKAEVQPEFRILKRGDWDDPEFTRQRVSFDEQFEKSEGYDVDWDNLYFDFYAIKFEWGGSLSTKHSNKEVLNMCIEAAIKEENEETGSDLEFVEYVSANVMGVKGHLFYITFWAKDLSSPNPEPKRYQAKVRKFCDEIEVSQFRLRPAQEQ